jgi:AAHS family 4-hydroxybenzoate transporter-like MFS transporter
MEQMMFLRFIAGIGLGGVMPNTISLNSELTPKKYRSALIVLMFMGITSGSTAMGLIAANYQAQYGWQILFHTGGILPVVVAIGLYFFLPESLKLLATKKNRQTELVRAARRMRRDLVVADDVEFINPPVVAESQGNITELFKGGLKLITPLLWCCFGVALLGNFFLNTTLPLIYDKYGIAAEDAAYVATLYHAGGTLGGVVVVLLLDRLGFLTVFGLFALGIPSIILLGAQDASVAFLGGMATLAGVAVLGAQFANNAAAGLLYPTSIRGKGVGTALSIGRFGAIAGPYIGAALLGLDITMQQLFLIAFTPFLIGLIAAAILSLLCYRRFKSFQLDDTPVE